MTLGLDIHHCDFWEAQVSVRLHHLIHLCHLGGAFLAQAMLHFHTHSSFSPDFLLGRFSKGCYSFSDYVTHDIYFSVLVAEYFRHYLRRGTHIPPPWKGHPNGDWRKIRSTAKSKPLKSHIGSARFERVSSGLARQGQPSRANWEASLICTFTLED